MHCQKEINRNACNNVTEKRWTKIQSSEFRAKILNTSPGTPTIGLMSTTNFSDLRVQKFEYRREIQEILVLKHEQLHSQVLKTRVR